MNDNKLAKLKTEETETRQQLASLKESLAVTIKLCNDVSEEKNRLEKKMSAIERESSKITKKLKGSDDEELSAYFRSVQDDFKQSKRNLRRVRHDLAEVIARKEELSDMIYREKCRLIIIGQTINGT